MAVHATCHPIIPVYSTHKNFFENCNANHLFK